MNISVRFGALSDPPSKQVRLRAEEARLIDENAEAITRLHLHGLLTASETVKARERLMKKIQAAVVR